MYYYLLLILVYSSWARYIVVDLYKYLNTLLVYLLILFF